MENKNLYQKMFKVMEGIKFIIKDTEIKFGNTNYKATSEETITPIFREKFLENKLMVFPVEQESSKNNGISKIDVKYKIVDIESGEYEILASSGEGSDTQDKGVGKAMTYAYKYMLLRTFMIPTGEDPDKISSAEIDHNLKKKSVTPKIKSEDDSALKKALMEKHKGDKEKAKEEYDKIKKEEADLKASIKEHLESEVA